MKAFELVAYDGPDGLRLSDTDSPVPTEGEVLIDVEAVGINFPDLLMTQGNYQLKPDLPFVPGCEVAGTVVHSPASSGFAIGERVACFVWKGGFAEQVVAPTRAVARIPDGFSAAEAAGLLVNYQTTLFALQRRAQLKAGAHVLVLGAAGGIGTAAVQVAKGLGAFVAAGVADHEQELTAAQAGADETYVLGRDFASPLRGITPAGRGFDVIVDPLGSWLFDEAVRALRAEGTLVVLGFAAGGDIPTIKVNRLLLRNIGVIGAAFGAFLDLDESLMASQAQTLGAMAQAGHVRPQIEDVYDFGDIPALLHRLRRGAIKGKAVVSLP